MMQEPLRHGHARRDSGPKRRSGFSLLEVLVAMFVLSLGASSVLALYAAAASTHRRALDRTHAALVAERIFSEVEGRYTPDFVRPEGAKDLRDKLRKEVPESFGNITWDVVLYRPGEVPARRRGNDDERGEFEPQELVVRLLLRWKQSGNLREETFFTILLPRNTALRTPYPR